MTDPCLADWLDAVWPDDSDPEWREYMTLRWGDDFAEVEPAPLKPARSYWQIRHDHFVEVVGWLKEDGYAFDPDCPVNQCVASVALEEVFGNLTADEVGLLFDLSRQRISAWEAELCSWLRIPMDHAINRDQRVAAIRKHLRQQEFDFAVAAE